MMFVSYSVYQWYDERKYAIKNNEYPTVKERNYELMPNNKHKNIFFRFTVST